MPPGRVAATLGWATGYSSAVTSRMKSSSVKCSSFSVSSRRRSSIIVKILCVVRSQKQTNSIESPKTPIYEPKKRIIPMTKHWTDWIDCWAVDFDFESKREIVQGRNEETGEVDEQWSGDYIFENEWQGFRTKKDRSLELTSAPHECPPDRRKIAAKVVDIFENDTMKILEVTI